MDPLWGCFSLWFLKRTEVILLLLASLLQYLSAMEVNKGWEGGLGWFKLGRFSQLLVFTRSERISCCRLSLSCSKAESPQRREEGK